jgi:hypothetical protein
VEKAHAAWPLLSRESCRTGHGRECAELIQARPDARHGGEAGRGGLAMLEGPRGKVASRCVCPTQDVRKSLFGLIVFFNKKCVVHNHSCEGVGTVSVKRRPLGTLARAAVQSSVRTSPPHLCCTTLSPNVGANMSVIILHMSHHRLHRHRQIARQVTGCSVTTRQLDRTAMALLVLALASCSVRSTLRSSGHLATRKSHCACDWGRVFCCEHTHPDRAVRSVWMGGG